MSLIYFHFNILSETAFKTDILKPLTVGKSTARGFFVLNLRNLSYKIEKRKQLKDEGMCREKVSSGFRKIDKGNDCY